MNVTSCSDGSLSYKLTKAERITMKKTLGIVRGIERISNEPQRGGEQAIHLLTDILIQDADRTDPKEKE